MCDRVNHMFRDLGSASLNPTEQKWVRRFERSYDRHRHLSRRQFNVLKDIHRRGKERPAYKK